VCKTRYLSGPPSGFSLRVMGRGMQTNSVRIASADNRTFAYPCPPRSTNSRCGARSGLDSDGAAFRSKVLAYSRHERTPCLSRMLNGPSGFARPTPRTCRPTSSSIAADLGRFKRSRSIQRFQQWITALERNPPGIRDRSAIEALCVFEARTDAVLNQHVEGPVWLFPRRHAESTSSSIAGDLDRFKRSSSFQRFQQWIYRARKGPARISRPQCDRSSLRIRRTDGRRVSAACRTSRPASPPAGMPTSTSSSIARELDRFKRSISFQRFQQWITAPDEGPARISRPQCDHTAVRSLILVRSLTLASTRSGFALASRLRLGLRSRRRTDDQLSQGRIERVFGLGAIKAVIAVAPADD
jgi:hypothetical protein